MLNKQRPQKYISYLLLFLLFLIPSLLFGAAKGKILGKVVDEDSGELLFGANIVLLKVSVNGVMQPVSNSHGAAADLNGEFVMLNISPGTYTVKVSYIGYASKIIEGIKVSINRTSNLNVELKSTTMETEEVVVVAKKEVIKKDKTSTAKTFSAEDISSFNLESIESVVELTTGVVEGHFRGGRSEEVSYLVDGVQSGIQLNVDAVQEIEVISGTFNAEYGKAMSGIVNTAPKEGGSKFSAHAKVFSGNYLTSHDYVGIESSDILHDTEIRFNLSGPIPLTNNKLKLFVYGKRSNNKGLHYGIDRYRSTDFTSVLSSIPEDTWTDIHSGNNSAIPMGENQKYEAVGNLTWNVINNLKVGLLYQYFNSSGQGQKDYDYSNKYSPNRTNQRWDLRNSFTFSFNHVIANNAFHEVKLLYVDTDFQKSRFKDPFDSRYVHNNLDTDIGGFNAGGNDKRFFFENTIRREVKYDIVWQINHHHEIKAGADYVKTAFEQETFSLRNIFENSKDKNEISKYKQYIPNSSTSFADKYTKNPEEFSVYVQDKAEFDDLVINFGVRYDRFDPHTLYPTDLRNPGNTIITNRKSEYLEAKVQEQISPRIGLAYTLGNAASLFFSYGHFMQIPNYEYLYSNPNWEISGTAMGNPNLDAEKTVKYELGLQLSIMEGLVVNTDVYYHDVYNLHTLIPIEAYDTRIYSYYTNKDYASTKGLSAGIDYRAENFDFTVNYTLQFAEGNSSDPEENFIAAGQKLDPITEFVPLDWDQKHSFNFAAGYNTKIYGASVVGRFGSGTRYTLNPPEKSRLTLINIPENAMTKPQTFYMDFKGYYNLDMFEIVGIVPRLGFYIYNIFDIRNEIRVYEDSGSAETTFEIEANRPSYVSTFTTIEDLYANPSNFSSPRFVKLELSLQF